MRGMRMVAGGERERKAGAPARAHEGGRELAIAEEAGAIELLIHEANADRCGRCRGRRRLHAVTVGSEPLLGIALAARAVAPRPHGVSSDRRDRRRHGGARARSRRRSSRPPATRRVQLRVGQSVPAGMTPPAHAATSAPAVLAALGAVRMKRDVADAREVAGAAVACSVRCCSPA